MRIEKAYHSLVNIGPGGRHCPCCTPSPRDLKRRERRKARQKANLEARTEAFKYLLTKEWQAL